MPKRSERLDILLVQRGEAPSLEKARRIIMAGGVYVDNQLVDKPGKRVPYDAAITLHQTDIPYVSRGGLKLQQAIHDFGIDVTGKVVIDVGASTGGFTDCLLQSGARFVYAVDVGYGQLDWKLRIDERVAVIERTNIRYVRREQFHREINLATIDVSFISLEKVLPVVTSLMRTRGQIIALIKPQFEAVRQNVSKGGVVRDPDIHRQVIKNICDLAARTGLKVEGLTYSPIKGPAGNIEYFVLLQKRGGHLDASADAQTGSFDSDVQGMIDRIVSEAHAAFTN